MPLSEIITRTGEYIALIKRKWLPWALMGLLGTFVAGMIAFFSPDEYQTYATFHPDTGQQGGFNPAGNPLSLIFGGEIGYGNANQMIGVLNSRRLSEMVVSDSIIMSDTMALLADLVIAKSKPLISFKSLFQFDKVKPTLDRKIVSAGKTVRSKLSVEATESGFIRMEFSFYTTRLTEEISQGYIKALQTYYRDQKTEKARNNFNFYEKLADSIKGELDKAAISVARFEDQNKNLVLASKRVGTAEQQVKLSNLQEMYKALIINREQARSQLLMDTPIVQILDLPSPPFRYVGRNIWIYSVFGLLLGIAVGMLVVSRTYWQTDIKRYFQTLISDIPGDRENI